MHYNKLYKAEGFFSDVEQILTDLDGVNHRYEVGIPLHVHLQPLQPGVHQEDDQQDGVDDGEAGQEVGEGGGDVVTREDDDGDGVGQDSQDTETCEENSLQRQCRVKIFRCGCQLYYIYIT